MNQSSHQMGNSLHTIDKKLRVFIPFALGYFLSYLYRVVNAVLAPDLASELGSRGIEQRQINVATKIIKNLSRAARARHHGQQVRAATRERDLGAFGPPNPVSLHGTDRFGPVGVAVLQ